MTELQTKFIPYVGTEGGWWASFNVKSISPSKQAIQVTEIGADGKTKSQYAINLDPWQGENKLIPAGVQSVKFEGPKDEFFVTPFQGQGDTFAYPQVFDLDPKN